MKIIVDKNIPFGKEAFENFGKVELFSGRRINSLICKNADVLIVRSVTKVNEELLNNSSVKFVGTTTIGTDHIDKNYLNKNNIYFSSGVGCNSYSVAEYVFSALSYFANKQKFNFNKKSIGIVGYGNIGKKIVAIAEAIGMKVVINDPPLKRKRNKRNFSTLEDVLKCDIVTFHVPLNKDGIDKTVHLLNEENISLIREGAILINSSRGLVVDNSALKKRLERKNDLFTVLDVWENEPNYNSDLLKLVSIGTPHIAGYSYEGKTNGTIIIYNALSKYLDINKKWKPKLQTVVDNIIKCSGSETNEEFFLKIFNKSYNIIEDDSLMRKGLVLPSNKRAEYFDTLRKKYKIRRELNNFEVSINLENEKFKNLLKILRLKLNEQKEI